MFTAAGLAARGPAPQGETRGAADLLARPAFVRTKVKRVLEYGVRAPVSSGFLREKAVFHKYLQEACFVITETSRNLWENVL